MQVGVVKSVEGRKVSVALSSDGACNCCGARRMCGASGEKTIEAWSDEAVRAGDKVSVECNHFPFLSVVGLCYGVPLLVLIAAFFSLRLVIESEWLLALMSLIVSSLWYVVLRIIRKKIEVRIECKKI